MLSRLTVASTPDCYPYACFTDGQLSEKGGHTVNRGRLLSGIDAPTASAVVTKKGFLEVQIYVLLLAGATASQSYLQKYDPFRREGVKCK